MNHCISRGEQTKRNFNMTADVRRERIGIWETAVAFPITIRRIAANLNRVAHKVGFQECVLTLGAGELRTYMLKGSKHAPLEFEWVSELVNTASVCC